MRITAFLMMLLCLGTVAQAQNGPSTNSSQPDSQTTLNSATTKNSAVKPLADSNCAPGGLNVNTGFQSNGGSGVATFTFTIWQTCGSPWPTSTSNWVTFNYSAETCSPNPEPLLTLITCKVPFTVAANTGVTRQAPVIVAFGSSGTLGRCMLRSTVQLRRFQ